MFKQLLELFTKQFIKKMGRSPMTAAEMMSIQNQVVNLINKTKGKIPLQKESKSPFQGFTPRVIEGGKGKAGIGTLLKDSPEAIAKIKADNKAAAERLRNKKKTVEDFSAEGDWDPSGMASGGIARVGMVAGGPIVKGAAWVIKNLKKSVKEVDQGKGPFSKLNPMQQGLLKKELNTLIKQLEQGGTIPNEMLDTMIADPKFKSMVKTRSTDKDLYELEDVLLDRQAGKQAEQIVDDVFGKGHTENQQIDMLEKFDVTGRKKNASGGIAGQLHLNRPGYESGLKVYPKIDITETGQTPAEGIDVGVRDITYGGTGLYQGDKWFAGAEGLTGDVKVDVTAEGKTLFKDTMSKDDALNYILGLGEAEGDKFQIKSDEDFDNVQIVFKKKFNQGGRASLSNGGLANILGV